MKTITLKLRTIFILGFIAILLGGCNIPGASPAETQPPEALFTSAAETVVAQFTADAVSQPTVTPQPEEVQDSAPQEPTQTLEPSPTFTLTMTPTQTETPSPTPTHNAEAIFEDDFSDESGWFTTDEDNYVFEFVDGGYRIYNNVLSAGYWSVRFQDYGDIRLEIDATRRAGPEDGYFGVVCRFGDDGEDYYALVIGDNGFYGILMMEDGEREFLVSGTDDKDIIQRGLGKTNRIAGVCNDDHLVLFANDQQLLEVFDDTFPSGDIGLIVGNPRAAAGTDVLFDNFAILWP